MLPVGWVDQNERGFGRGLSWSCIRQLLLGDSGQGGLHGEWLSPSDHLVLPDLDMVAVVTGRSGYSLEHLLDLVISSAVSDSTLPR